MRSKLTIGLAWIAAVTVAAVAFVTSMPRTVMADGPGTDPAYDTSLVSVEKLLNVYAGGPSTTPPSDWIPGVGNIPGILINPPGGPPIIVPTAPGAPYTPWSPWKIPGSWVPGGYPNGRIPGIIKWNPTKRQWEFWPVPNPEEGQPGHLPPIILPEASIVITPVGGDPVEVSPIGTIGEDDGGEANP